MQHASVKFVIDKPTFDEALKHFLAYSYQKYANVLPQLIDSTCVQVSEIGFDTIEKEVDILKYYEADSD